MIDDATILEKAHRMATKYKHTNNEPYLFNPRHIVDFARAIEQLARQKQREEDARIAESHWEIDGTITAKEFADTIRAAGKENSNE